MDIQSNCLRGKFMKDIVDKTINEIHDDMVTVFGPGAEDAFITKDNQPYYTRDGKEVIASMSFDNELSMYILKILYQAVENQARKVGDGTTTVAVLYTEIYRTLKQMARVGKISRSEWNEACKILIDEIVKNKQELDEEKFKSMVYTCTQDIDITEKIYNNLYEAIMNHAFIVINKADIDTDFQMTVNEYPLVKATKLFSIRPIKKREDNCVLFHCNGILDITDENTFLDLMSQMAQYQNGSYHQKTIIILCNGISEVTRKTTKTLVNTLKSNNIKVEDFNNIAIYALDEYRSYDAATIEDLSTIITDELGIGGLVSQLTFESLLAQTFKNPSRELPEQLAGFDCDIRHMDKLREMLNNECTVEFDELNGMKINKKLGPVAQKRYDDLVKEINEEKGVKRVRLNERLRKMYGQFIEVEVGSKLIKDSQRKYELILDAVLSASEAAEHGVLTSNSLLTAFIISGDILEHEERRIRQIPEQVGHAINIIFMAICKVLDSMCRNVSEDIDLFEDDTAAHDMYRECQFNQFDLTRIDNIIPDDEEKLEVITTESGFSFTKTIVEPVSIITTMIENSTTMLDLYNAKTFHVNSFMRNYI